MPSINNVELMGHLGADPEIRTAKSGKVFANIRIATSYKPREGEEKTTWWRVTAFGAMAEQMSSCRKGDLVYVSGRGEQNSWTDNEGERRTSFQVLANVCVKAIWNKSQQSAPPPNIPFDDEVPF
jgi:single-strand DNA-binding protein